ncbi:hypothetical protein [Paraburkholderia sprentiae]|uniref:hypothetical protein n=1 Tax=Paraburkholderia sprentiae TaxID=948107 RepID=UPI00389A1D95
MRKQIVAHVHFFLHGTVFDDSRCDRCGLCFLPALFDVLDVAAHAQGIDFFRRRVDTYCGAAIDLVALGIDNVFEQKAASLRFRQTPELPLHQWHQFRLLANRTADSEQLAGPFKFFEVGTEILRIIFPFLRRRIRHCRFPNFQVKVSR